MHITLYFNLVSLKPRGKLVKSVAIIFKEMLPKHEILPDTFYEARKMIARLKFTYNKVDACPNDRITYSSTRRRRILLLYVVCAGLRDGRLVHYLEEMSTQRID